jgi:hypothetical protein
MFRGFIFALALPKRRLGDMVAISLCEFDLSRF